MMAMRPALNLFKITSIANDWQVIDPDGYQSAWLIRPDGSATQTESIGSRKQGSGTLLLLNDSNKLDEQLNLTLAYSSVHQMGLVFNYKDPDDFCLFIIDRKGVNFEGYEAKILEIRSGTTKKICLEKYLILPNNDITLTIKQVNSSICFSISEQEIYSWNDRDIKSGKVGLYSYKSNDGYFSELVLDHVDSVQVPLANNSTTPVVEEDSIKREINSDLVKFLELQKPDSKTTIEFKEVYSVPLDEYYQSILNGFDLVASEGEKVNISSIVEYLDIRTKRWYRLYEDYSKKINYAETDLLISERQMDVALKRIDEYFDAQESGNETVLVLNELESELEKVRSSVAYRKNRIYKYRDKINVLLREIRTNGYDVKKDTKIDKVIKAGYSFQIDKSVSESIYEPIQFDPRMWLGEDVRGSENWSNSISNMSALLVEGDILTGSSREEYMLQQPRLESYDANQDLNERVEKIQSYIGEMNHKIIYAEYDRDVYMAERELWLADIKDLKYIKNYFESKYFDPTMNSGLKSKQDCVNYINELLAWLIGDVPALYKVVNLTDNYNDPGMDYQNIETNSGYAFRKMNINSVNHNVRRFILPQLEANSDLNRCDYKFYGMRVFSYLLSDRITWRQTSQDYTGFVLGVSGEYSNSDRMYYSGAIYIGMIDYFTEARRLHDFFEGAINICNYKLDITNRRIQDATNSVVVHKNIIAEHNREITVIKEYGLHKLRWDFIKKWNDPEKNGTGLISRKPILPASDPLAEFLIETSKNEDDINNEVVFFQPTSSGFYNQFGQSLQNFMSNNSDNDSVVVLPYFDSVGSISNEVIQVVRNPIASNKTPGMPVIKLVESYTLEVGWQGYALGELSHSFNLFPGESKELVVEKSTKKTSKISEKVGREEARKQSTTSSFEDNLSSELSSGLKGFESSEMKSNDASSSKSLDKNSSSDESSNSQDITETQDRNWEVSAKADANWGWGSAEISGSAGGKSNVNANTKSNRKSTWNNSNEDAYEISKSTEGQLKNNQSSEVMKKNLSNSVKKVANETSSNNKLEFSSTSSEEYQEESSNKEVIKLENPNIGKTINYNFFQVQNIYGTQTNISDVKIVVDSGKELIDKTGINDVKVYEIEEFGKIFCNSDGSDRSAIISAIIARKVLNHYANIPPYFNSGNGAIQLPSGYDVDSEQ